ncbi:MAG TPA: hypothetical protein VND21_09070 [Planctomycetota bacterium]|jgi:hypothetical protein|nr:hypothetical protein [Planctomycetota bacterium]
MGYTTATVLISVTVSAATAFLVGRATAPQSAPPEDVAASLKESLRDVEATLREIRRSLDERPALAAAPLPVVESGSAPPQTARTRPPAAEEPVTGSRPAPVAGTAAPLLPQGNLSRAAEIHGWEKNDDVRRRWFLVSEAEALSVFGTPQSVYGWESGETWEYQNEEWSLSLRFLRGRLVSVSSIDKRQ